MSILLSVIADEWEADPTLSGLVPIEKVYTGRFPGTSIYNFPYVSIIASGGRKTHRSDKARYSYDTITFHVWVGDTGVLLGERICDAIIDVFADRCFQLSPTVKVIDFMVNGEPNMVQTQLPGAKPWDLILSFTAHVQRERVDREQCCDEESWTPDESSSTITDESSASSSST